MKSPQENINSITIRRDRADEYQRTLQRLVPVLLVALVLATGAVTAIHVHSQEQEQSK